MAPYLANKEVERIIRPIAEGQIRGFLQEHPAIVEAVDWYKPHTDKAKTFTSSLSKRIVRDLACGITAARLAAVLVEPGPAAPLIPPVEEPTAEKAPGLAYVLARAIRLWAGAKAA